MAGRIRRGGPGIVLLLGVALATFAGSPPVAAADAVTFGPPTATSAFGRSIDFAQPVDLAAVPERVEILLRTPGSAGPEVVEVEAPAGAGDRVLRFSLPLADGHVVPNTTFTARWRVTEPGGRSWLGPEASRTYADDRVEWRSLAGDIVRVHWYEGDAAFGRRALRIGEESIAETASLLGVTETEPIDFYIYADGPTFRDALGPSTREWTGGQAHSEIRTLFALISPAEIDDPWVDVVIPHELVHLVFATAIESPYHEPPHWLNEGLAVYLSEGFGSSNRSAVEGAAADGTLMPLEGLSGAFPTASDRTVLAYAESVAAVDHIVRVHGRDALVKLIRSYATGVSDDEAFEAALGVDVAAFEAGWLDELGATPPVRHGPQPAPPGPVPPGWSGLPGPDPAPVATATPGTGTPGSPSSSGGDAPPAWVLIGLVVVGTVAAALLVIRRRSALRGP